MILRQSVDIAAPPSRIYRFFEDMADNYTDWHPDHLVFRWVDGAGLTVGCRFYFEERIAGKLMKKTVRLTRLKPDRHIEFVPDWWLMRLFLPRILFRIEPVGEGCRVTQELHVRTGPVGAWLNRREFNAVRQHMREEGENLKRLTEAWID